MTQQKTKTAREILIKASEFHMDIGGDFPLEEHLKALDRHCGLSKFIEEAEQRSEPKPWLEMNEAKLDNLVYKWLVKNDWDYKKYGDKRTNREAYQTLMFYEVSELLHNSLVDFSRHLFKERAAPVPIGLSDEQIETLATEWGDQESHKLMGVRRYNKESEAQIGFIEGYKAAQTTSIPRATIDEVVSEIKLAREALNKVPMQSDSNLEDAEMHCDEALAALKKALEL